jgi:hypothetical protein
MAEVERHLPREKAQDFPIPLVNAEESRRAFKLLSLQM